MRCGWPLARGSDGNCRNMSCSRMNGRQRRSVRAINSRRYPRIARQCMILMVAGGIAFCSPSSHAQPANDDCADAIPIGDGTFAFSNIGATTDGPATCAEMGSDLWFIVEQSCAGSVSISTCTPARTFDTALAAIGRCGQEPWVCNDDDLSRPGCGEGGSTIRVYSRLGSRFLIQVGGHGGTQGDAELVIRCCEGDIDGDGQVALSDLAILLSDFTSPCGAAGHLPSDMNGDCAVDLTDLAIMLNNFATICP